MRFPNVALALLVLLVPGAALAQGKTFILASKNLSDFNFIVAFKAFEEAARLNGDRAVHVGSPGASHFRLQDKAIAEALEGSRVAGIAVSVLDPDWLAARSIARAKELGVSVVAFDSDFSPRTRSARAAYVGPDNVEFGRAMAGAIKARLPGGGKIAIMNADSRDPNLDDRVSGLRRGLSGDPAFPRGKRLEGQGGWTENAHSPWYNGDDDQRARGQLAQSLDEGVDAFASVGSWLLADLPKLREVLWRFSPDLKAGRRVLAIGVGTPTEEQRALVDEGLVSAYVSIDFTEIGRTAYRVLKKVTRGGAVPEINHVPSVLIQRR